jgi:hypothetical protein
MIKKTIKLNESELVSIIKKMINENYDPSRLYSRNHVAYRLKMAPRELRRYIKELPHIDCVDANGNKHVCTKIPEVVYVFLQGIY